MGVTKKCPVCGSLDQELLYDDMLGDDMPSFDYNFSPENSRPYQVMKCRSCTHAFSIVPHEDLWKNYQNVIDNEYLTRQNERIMTARDVVGVLRKVKSYGKLLDVGCATGDFLSVAQHSYDVEGLELSRWSSNIARERGFRIYNCRLDKLPKSKMYDIVTLWGVIEHFESPRGEVRNMFNHLNPGGVVCLWTGDVNSWVSRMLGRKWWYVKGEHIQLFTRESLCRLFTNNGFDLVSVENYPWHTDLRSVGKSLMRYPLISKTFGWALKHSLLAGRSVRIMLPGEMYAIFRKVENDKF